jgi:outer membrane lipoprotein-sorting protein
MRNACSLRVLTVVLVHLWLWSAPAAADGAGERILAQMDTALTKVDTQRFSYEILTKSTGSTPRRLETRVVTKGSKLRRFDLLDPGDVKGMKVLILSRSQIYVYVPQLRKVRRVASHVQKSSFMGTTFSYHDTAIVTYSDAYKGKLLEETKTHWKVEGTRRPGQDIPYPKLVFLVRKDNHHPARIEYYNEAGKKVKTETRSDYICQEGMCTQREDKMVDHERGDHWTRIVLKAWKPNIEIPARFFTVKELERRR